MYQQNSDQQELNNMRRARRLQEQLNREETRESAASMFKGILVILVGCGICCLMGEGLAMVGTFIAALLVLPLLISGLIWLCNL